MRVRKVAVNFANEDAAVRMSEPGGDRHKVDFGHDALAREEMPQIVEPDPV